MPDKPPLPPGILPNIFDTDPPPLHPATEVGDGYVRVDETKLKVAEAVTEHRAQHHPRQEAPQRH